MTTRTAGGGPAIDLPTTRPASGDLPATGSAPGPLARLVSGRRTSWLVLALWIALIAGVGGFAARLGDVQKNDSSTLLPAAADSARALKIQADFHPDWYPAVLLYVRPSGLTAGDRAAVDHAVSVLRQRPAAKDLDLVVASAVRVQEVTTGPDAGKAVQVVVPVDPGTGGWSRFPQTLAAIRNAMGPASPGLSTYVTGPLGVSGDQADAFSRIDASLTGLTALVVIVVLLVAYRSPVLWLLPLATVGGGVLVVTEAVVYLLAAHAGLTVNSRAAFILVVLVFGVGTDYALLLIARYREELRRHRDRHEAMAHALHRVGPALLASAATVAVSMLVLLAADLRSTRSMGPVLAVGVLVAAAAMLTLMPALLVIVGRWIFWPSRPVFGSPEPTRRGVWFRTGRRIASRPRAVWIVTALCLAACVAGVGGLDPHEQSAAEQFVHEPDSIRGAKVQARYFPAASGEPLVVVGDAPRAAAVADALRRVPGVDPASVGVPQGLPAPVVNGHFYLEAATTAAADSPAGQATVDRARAAVRAVPGAGALVGGNAALYLDIGRASDRDTRVVIPLILLAVLLILALLLRAVVAPVVLVLTVVLSFGATLGLSALAFRALGWHGVDEGMPLLVFVFLVALGIDYNIFLMTRVREESARRGTRAGAVAGLSATGGVITWAGLVLAATFGVLATLPVVPFAEIGIVVSLGVLIDTLIVRSVLVTALTLDLGRVIWWPSALSRAPQPEAAGAGHRTPAPVR